MDYIVHRWRMGAQKNRPHCTLCGGRLFGGEVYYRVQQQSVCRDCLPLLARRVFAPYRCQVEEECL